MDSFEEEDVSEDVSYYMSDDDDVESEEDLVFFLQDSGDDDDDYVPLPTSTARPRSPIRQLSPSLVAKMEAANVGRLKWLERSLEQQPPFISVEDAALFPTIGESTGSTGEPRHQSSRGKWPKTRTPVRLRVNFVKDGPYEIKFNDSKFTVPCNFIINDQTCPYGEKCKYNHDVPMCNAMKNGNLCMRGTSCKYRHPTICQCKKQECTLFHPKKEDLARLRGMKTRMCKNVLKTDPATGKRILAGKCHSGDACKFAHTMAQVRDAAEPCRQKDKCKLVKLVSRTNATNNVKKTLYKNVSDEQTCWRIHPEEVVANFVARTSARPIKRPVDKRPVDKLSNKL